MPLLNESRLEVVTQSLDVGGYRLFDCFETLSGGCRAASGFWREGEKKSIMGDMATKTVARFFPRSRGALIHQDGSRASAPSTGVEVVLHTSGDHCAEIGLWFEDGKLSEYDGVFALPREVGEMLTDAGYVVPEDCFA
jgi:hypothetical protein